MMSKPKKLLKSSLAKKITVATSALSPLLLIGALSCSTVESFTPDATLKDLVSNNLEIKTSHVAKRTYSVFQGDREWEFDSRAEAYNFVSEHGIKSATYLKLPNFDSFAGTKEVDASQIMLATSAPQVRTFKKADGTFTYALETDQQGINAARSQAALSYIQVHNGYQYQGYLFDNFNDVESFVRSLNDVEIKDLLEGRLTTRQMVRFNDGTVKSFSNFQEIKLAMANSAAPYYKDNLGNLIPLNQQNTHQIASSIAEDDLAFIPISSNDGKGSQVVDMDATTPNGQLYGPYLLQSGIGLDGVYDPLNWKPLTPNSQVTSYQETYEEQILNAYVSNLILKQGVMFDDFVMDHKVYLDDSGMTLTQYLETISSTVNYASVLQSFFSTIRQGTRYTALNSIILARAFLMDKMIQNKEDTNKIIYLSKFFHSMANTLDIYNTAELAPFLVGSPQLDASGNVIPAAPIKISYFADTLAFDTEGDFNNYAFQTDPGYYYRKLIGLDDKFKPVNSQNNRVIFKLIHASFGPLIMMDQEVENIKAAYDSSVKRLKDTLVANGKTVPSAARADQFKLIFDYAPRRDMFVGATFANDQSQEFELIWSLLDDAALQGSLSYQTYDAFTQTWINKVIKNQFMRSNYSGFLVQSQNQILSRFVNQLKTEIDKINSQVVDGKFAAYEDVWKSEPAAELLNTSIATFMASRISLVVDNLPQTLKQRQAILQGSIQGLLPSAADKWLSFAGNFLLPMFNVTTSVVIATQMAIPFVKSIYKKIYGGQNDRNRDDTTSVNGSINQSNKLDESTTEVIDSSQEYVKSAISDYKKVKKLVRSDSNQKHNGKLDPSNSDINETSIKNYERINFLKEKKIEINDENLSIADHYLTDGERINFHFDPTMDLQRYQLVRKGLSSSQAEYVKLTTLSDAAPRDFRKDTRENEVLFLDNFTYREVRQAFFNDPSSPYHLPSIYKKLPAADKKKLIDSYTNDITFGDGLTKKEFDTLIKGDIDGFAQIIENKMDTSVWFRQSTNINDRKNLEYPVIGAYVEMNQGITLPIKLAFDEYRKAYPNRSLEDFHQEIFGYNYALAPIGLATPSLTHGSSTKSSFTHVSTISPSISADSTLSPSITNSTLPRSLSRLFSQQSNGSSSFSWDPDSTLVASPTQSISSLKLSSSLGKDIKTLTPVPVRPGLSISHEAPGWLGLRTAKPSLKIQNIIKRSSSESDIFKLGFNKVILNPDRKELTFGNASEASQIFEDLGASANDFSIQLAGSVASDNDIASVASKPSQVVSDSIKANASKVSTALLSFQSVAMVSVGLSSLLGIAAAISQMVATFENIQVIPYEFKTREGVSLYWDGTRVTSRTWGLDNTINFSIKDLKMVTANVISGYTANEQGIYHNGKFYKDTTEIRKLQANELVRLFNNMNRVNESVWNIKVPNAVWKIEIAEFDNDLQFDSINDLLYAVEANHGSLFHGYDQVYRLFDDKVTNSETLVIDDIIKVIAQNLKKSLIFKLPEVKSNGMLDLGRFQLPEPYYSNGRKFNKPTITDPVAFDEWTKRSASYIVYNQNINKKWLDLEAGKNAAERDILYEYFNKIYQTDLEVAFDDILIANLAKIPVLEKTTTLNEVLKSNQFDDLLVNDVNNEITIYYFTNKQGKVRYFTNQNAAILALTSDGTASVYQNDNITEQVSYVYNNQVFASMEEIYTHIKNNQ